MATSTSFNVCLNQFLTSLKTVFPEKVASFDLVMNSVDFVAKDDPAAPSKLFFQTVSPHLPKIIAKDESVFPALGSPFGLDLAGLWVDKGLSAASREAIWGYLTTLTMLSMTSSMPPELVSAIDSMASGAAEKVKAGEDLNVVAMSMIQNILGGNGEGGGNNFLNQLLQNQ